MCGEKVQVKGWERSVHDAFDFIDRPFKKGHAMIEP